MFYLLSIIAGAFHSCLRYYLDGECLTQLKYCTCISPVMSLLMVPATCGVGAQVGEWEWKGCNGDSHQELRGGTVAGLRAHVKEWRTENNVSARIVVKLNAQHSPVAFVYCDKHDKCKRVWKFST
jgi:hypothetical protein